MIFELFTLGVGAISRAFKNESNRLEGERILKERTKKSVWQQAKESGSMVTINGQTHYFLNSREIYMNEQFWNSGLPLEDFLVKFYKDNNGFPDGFMRFIDREGVAHQVSGYSVMEMYNKKYKK